MLAVPSFVAPLAHAQEVAPISAEQLLNVQAGVASIIHEALGERAVQKTLSDDEALRAFYEARNFEPYWVGRSGAKSRARDLVEIIEESWMHGLNPYSYNLENIHGLKNAREDAQLADLDILLSDAFVRLGQDLSGIRVNPSFMRSHKKFWKAPFTAEHLLTRLSEGRVVERLIESMEPRGQTYKHLQRELVRLVNSKPEPYEAVLPLRT
ncbi:MAG: hypothetical protein AAF204_04405, partial [Pseudomonadota bacterium]